MIFQNTIHNAATAFGATTRRQAFADLSNSNHFSQSQTNINSSHCLPLKKPLDAGVLAANGNPFVPQCVPEPANSFSNPTSYQHSAPADDIDERDRDDPLAVAEYAQDMYNHFREQERITSPRPNYMDQQTQITAQMRSILIDWIVSVQVQFKLGPETLYLAVNIIDRYLCTSEVQRSKLQLVGATSLLIAAKYEEVYNCPRVLDIVLICDKLYPRQEIVQMETTILCALGFKISVPTAHAFLARYLKAGHADAPIAQLACYILEGTLQNYSMLQYLPSQLACASIMIARHATNRNPWSPTLLKYTEYYEEEIIPIAKSILDAKACAGPELTAVNAKYSARRFGRVAKTDFSFMW